MVPAFRRCLTDTCRAVASSNQDEKTVPFKYKLYYRLSGCLIRAAFIFILVISVLLSAFHAAIMAAVHRRPSADKAFYIIVLKCASLSAFIFESQSEPIYLFYPLYEWPVSGRYLRQGTDEVSLFSIKRLHLLVCGVFCPRRTPFQDIIRPVTEKGCRSSPHYRQLYYAVISLPMNITASAPGPVWHPITGPISCICTFLNGTFSATSSLSFSAVSMLFACST